MAHFFHIQIDVTFQFEVIQTIFPPAKSTSPVNRNDKSLQKKTKPTKLGKHGLSMEV